MAKHKESPKSQVAYTEAYVELITEHINLDNTVQMGLQELLYRLSRDLRYSELGHLLGVSPSLVALWRAIGETKPGIKVEMAVLRRITIDGKHVSLTDSPETIMMNYASLHSQGAHCDGKLHDVGLDGSEWTYYDAT